MNAKELGKQFAHPGVREGQHGLIISQNFWGLTKRELFAAMAMHALGLMQKVHDGHDVESVAGYRHASRSGRADALLAELAKDQP